MACRKCITTWIDGQRIMKNGGKSRKAEGFHIYNGLKVQNYRNREEPYWLLGVKENGDWRKASGCRRVWYGSCGDENPPRHDGFGTSFLTVVFL